MAFDASTGITDFLKSKGLLGLNRDEQLIALVRSVAEIPWGDGRTLEEVLSTKKVGTCTGKHLVLQECLDRLDFEYEPVVCTFRWGEQRIRYPNGLRNILRKGEWDHGHNFVRIRREDGALIDIDVTWNSKLKPYGFKTFPESWDGKTAFIGLDKIIKRWDGVEIGEMKKELIDSLTPELRERRELFLQEFIRWIDSINDSTS